VNTNGPAAIGGVLKITGLAVTGWVRMPDTNTGLSAGRGIASGFGPRVWIPTANANAPLLTDPVLIDPVLIDPVLIDPVLIDPLLIDSVLIDSVLIDFVLTSGCGILGIGRIAAVSGSSSVFRPVLGIFATGAGTVLRSNGSK